MIGGLLAQCLAAIVRNPDLVHGHDAGLLVDGDFDHLGRIAVAHRAANGGAAIFLAAVGCGDGRIVTGHSDRAGILQRFGDDLVES